MSEQSESGSSAEPAMVYFHPQELKRVVDTLMIHGPIHSGTRILSVETACSVMTAMLAVEGEHKDLIQEMIAVLYATACVQEWFVETAKEGSLQQNPELIQKRYQSLIAYCATEVVQGEEK